MRKKNRKKYPYFVLIKMSVPCSLSGENIMARRSVVSSFIQDTELVNRGDTAST